MMKASASTQSYPVQRLVRCALFVALLIVGGFLRIPLPLWPFTLQTLFVLLAGMLLGARDGAICCTAYVALGLFGLPVFTGGGGLSYIFKPTFGCLLAFIAAAWLAGWWVERVAQPRFSTYLIAGLLSTVLIYVIGAAWFWCVKALYLSQPMSLPALFMTFCAPTLPTDFIKVVLAALLSCRLRPMLIR